MRRTHKPGMQHLRHMHVVHKGRSAPDELDQVLGKDLPSDLPILMRRFQRHRWIDRHGERQAFHQFPIGDGAVGRQRGNESVIDLQRAALDAQRPARQFQQATASGGGGEPYRIAGTLDRVAGRRVFFIERCGCVDRLNVDTAEVDIELFGRDQGERG